MLVIRLCNQVTRKADGQLSSRLRIRVAPVGQPLPDVRGDSTRHRVIEVLAFHDRGDRFDVLTELRRGQILIGAAGEDEQTEEGC